MIPETRALLRWLEENTRDDDAFSGVRDAAKEIAENEQKVFSHDVWRHPKVGDRA